MNVVIDDLLTNYRLSGKGRLVLLLHGWGDSAKGLAGLHKDLEKHYQVLALDLPGFGGSEAPKVAWDLDDYARFLAALLKKLDLGQPYAVLGHSNGGALAIRAIAMKQLKPDRLVLLAAAGIRTHGSSRRRLLKIVAKTGSVATIWMPQRYRQGLRRSLYGAAGSDLLVVPGMEATFRKTVRQDVQADAAVLEVPALLIYAADDTAVPVEYGREYHDLIPRSRLEIIENAGHFVHTDQPDTVAKLVEEFLR